MSNAEKIGCLLYEAIISGRNFYHHNNIVLIGNNSVGKTQSIRRLFDIVKQEKNRDIYYIDSQNRILTDNSIGENTITKRYIDFDVLEIVEARTSKENMAQHDVFSNYEAGPITTISELVNGIGTYSDLFEKTIGISLSVMKRAESSSELTEMVESSKRDRVLVNGTMQQIETLSSSESSKMRILMEVYNALKHECKAVVIDEFDIHFDNDQIPAFMNIIMNTFPNLRFVFVVHDPEIIVNISDVDALIYNIDGVNGIYKKIDSNDISEISQIHRLRAKYLGRKSDSSLILENCVTQLVENGILDSYLKSKYFQIEIDKLTGKEKVWYSYIQKRLHNAH